MSEQAITAKNVDLSNCDRELVQYVGAIQPHGAMLVVNEQTYAILQASRNIENITGLALDQVIGAPIESVLGRGNANLLGRAPLQDGPVYVLRESFSETSTSVNVFAHRCGGVLLIELESVPEGRVPPTIDLYSKLRMGIARLQATPTLQAFFDMAVSQIRDFTDYDRVMAYKFHPDGSGHVIAEAKRDDLEPYLGLHYPATDIPAPARRLFGLSWLRHLPDTDYSPVPLVPEHNPLTGQPVDMSYSILRSVSVMYSEYLKNMGVKSTTVMPLMREGKLWGLISAMHHDAPKHLPYDVRMAAEFLAHMLSLLMSAKESVQTYEQRLRMSSVTDQLVNAFNREPDLHVAFGSRSSPVNVLAQVPAGGAAVVSHGKVTLCGSTPCASDVLALAAWLDQQKQPVFATDALSEHYPPAAQYKTTASGLLALHLAHRSPEYLLWFRPEQLQTVTWAGNPNKPVEIDETNGLLVLRPRNSFARWKESVLGRAEPWQPWEIEAVANLRRALFEALLGRAEEIERINRELIELNVELDSFAYAASHDLKEPLRGIHHLATFLKRENSTLLSEEAKKQLDMIMRLTRRMDDLIEALLHYSKTGRSELTIETVDLDRLLDEAIATCRHRIAETNTAVRRSDSLGTAACDSVQVREVFTNLIGNALKYNDKSTRWIEVGVEQARPKRYFVRDNGIGIEQRHLERIFLIFRRLHGRDEFGGGSGAGLTIARKTVERHGGRMWVISKPGEGSTFYFTLEPESDR